MDKRDCLHMFTYTDTYIRTQEEETGMGRWIEARGKGDESKSLWIIVLVLLWVKKGRKGHGASKLDMDRVWAAAFLSTRTEQDRTRDSRE